MSERRIVILDAAGQPVAAMDVTGLANANAAAPIRLAVETLCSLGTWHREQEFITAPWGPE